MEFRLENKNKTSKSAIFHTSHISSLALALSKGISVSFYAHPNLLSLHSNPFYLSVEYIIVYLCSGEGNNDKTPDWMYDVTRADSIMDSS
jgi:hypothetical protein